MLIATLFPIERSGMHADLGTAQRGVAGLVLSRTGAQWS
jgi:hypothetical protein